MPNPQVRCPTCRRWIRCTVGATKVPMHNDIASSGTCPGSNKTPAGHLGW